MFEKEAEEYIKEHSYFDEEFGVMNLDVTNKTIFQAGAEFGYKKGFEECAKARLNVTTISDCPIKDEWHYVDKEGLPKKHGWYFVNYKNDTYDCAIVTKDLRLLNFHTNQDMTDAVYAWKEIVPPKESE